MPGFVTHYVFGKKAIGIYGQNQSVLADYINEHREIYDMGLQGPDMFFYYFLSKVFYKRNIGSIMHTKDIGKFKKNFLEICLEEKNDGKRRIGLSYLAGFVGHCALDCTCHPYVYAVTDYAHKGKNYFSKHVDLETGIDYIYAGRILGADLYEYRKKDSFDINSDETKYLAELYVKAIKKTYPNIKITKMRMRFIINIFKHNNIVFTDRFGVKKKIVSFIEEVLLKRKTISPMFVVKNEKRNDKDVMNESRKIWISPWETDKKRNESFDMLFDKALNRYEYALEEINNIINKSNNKKINEVTKESMELLFANLSLHSGLDCSIPS